MRRGIKKRILVSALAALICVSLALPCAAASGRIIDYALYTDITAKINGHAIRSYNIGGYTAVVAEDLKNYGFDVVWYGAERKLTVARATRNGELMTPENFPDYTAPKLTRRVGSRAKPVYGTDIVTYIAGERADSFNIGGETLVWFEHLEPFGSVVWDGGARVIELTLGDPVEIALEPIIRNLEDWRDFGGPGSEWRTWTSKRGTLLYTRYTGTPHGSLTGLRFIRNSGEILNITDMLPPYGFGAGYYFNPREITLNGAGTRLSFITPLKEAFYGTEDGVKYWGDTLCTVDLERGEMLSMQPLGEGFGSWQADARADNAEIGERLDITVKRSGAQVGVTKALLPSRSVDVHFDATGAVITNYGVLMEEENPSIYETAYGKAYMALAGMGLPDAAKGDDFENTPEQRQTAAEYLTVTLNGEDIACNLWWSAGSGHRDLYVIFTEEVRLKDGDELRLAVGDR